VGKGVGIDPVGNGVGGVLFGAGFGAAVDGPGVGEVGGAIGADVVGAGDCGVGADDATSNDFSSLLPNSPPDATSLPLTLTE